MNDYERLVYKKNKQKRQLNILTDKTTEYKAKIDTVKEFCYRYLSLNLDDFDSRKLLEKILEILGDDIKDENK